VLESSSQTKKKLVGDETSMPCITWGSTTAVGVNPPQHCWKVWVCSVLWLQVWWS